MNHLQHKCLFGGAPMAATTSTVPPPPPTAPKKRRRKEIKDDEDVEVVALAVEVITAESHFICEYCNKGFNREQNLQIHKKGHNVACVLKNPNKTKDDKRKVFVCPDITCTNHIRRNALGDLTSLKKHYRRKHSEKTIKCTKCNKKYAVQADLKAHVKICGTREYKCDCGCIFSRRDSYTTHKTLCNTMTGRSFSLENNFPTTRTTLGNLFGPSIFGNPSSQPIGMPAFSAITTTTTPIANSFPFLNNTIPAPPNSNLQSSALLFNHFDHGNITNPVNNAGQGSQFDDSNFDINELYDRLVASSSAPLVQEAPQQGYTLANSGISAPFLKSLENSTSATDFSRATDENSYLPEFGTNIVNPADPFAYYTNNIGNDVFSPENEVMQSGGGYYGNNISDNGNKAEQNSGPSEFGDGLQFNQEQLPRNENGVGGDANFTELQTDIGLWKNWG